MDVVVEMQMEKEWVMEILTNRRGSREVESPKYISGIGYGYGHSNGSSNGTGIMNGNGDRSIHGNGYGTGYGNGEGDGDSNGRGLMRSYGGPLNTYR